jgi:DNA-binding MarR family transcriptional regulator
MTRRRSRNILNPTVETPLVSDRMDQLIGYHVRRVQIIVMQRFEKLADSRITPAMLHLLLLIDENPGVSMSTIASEHGVDRASLVPAIQRMESQGWIERRSSPDDRRILMLRCTPAGSLEAQTMFAKVEAMEAALLGDLSASEQRQLLSLLKRVARRARATAGGGVEGRAQNARAARRSQKASALPGSNATGGDAGDTPATAENAAARSA